METIFHKRIKRLRKLIQENEIDTLMITTNENRRYLSGFTGEDSQFNESSGALFINEDKLVFATDSRFVLQAKNEASLFQTYCYKKGVSGELSEILKEFNTKKLGFESKRVSYFQYNTLCKHMKETGFQIDLIPIDDLLDTFRIIKDEDEIGIIKKALHLSEAVFTEIKEDITPGLTEIEISWELEKRIREKGGEALSFPSIIASGENGALPHAIPGERKTQINEGLLFDWGTILAGYCSDISRTVYLGTPDDTFKKVFNTVREAQEKAIAAIQAGKKAKEIDEIARSHISKNGYGDYFGHGLGHGVGICVHEPPSLSPLSDTTLSEGMVITVEPGIYLPGWGGVRLENMIVVRKDKAEVLNTLDCSDYLIEM